MTWKPTPEQLARARAAIAAEKAAARKPKKKPHAKQKHKPKRAKRNRKKRPAPDHITQAYLHRFGPWGIE